MANSVSLEELRKAIGTEIGVSEWIKVEQQRVDLFADVTEDHQFIHVDPVRAASTPFGGTLAHGFLTLSLLTRMLSDVMPPIENAAMGLNYGFDKIRFLNPVVTGSRIRGRFTLRDIVNRGAGENMISLNVSVEIEGAAKPALVADWLLLSYVAA